MLWLIGRTCCLVSTVSGKAQKYRPRQLYSWRPKKFAYKEVVTVSQPLFKAREFDAQQESFKRRGLLINCSRSFHSASTDVVYPFINYIRV